MNYLSDEELEKLIMNIEENDLVTAPPDIAPEVISKLSKEKSRQDKVIEFHHYCIEVIGALVASFVVLFSIPWLQEANLNLPEFGNEQVYQTKEAYSADHQILSREEQLNQSSETALEALLNYFNK